MNDANLPPLARALNERLEAGVPATLRMLSARGRAAFFPSKGILGQTAEARGKRINATIGIALEDDGSPLTLPLLREQLDLAPTDAFTYAPSFGKPALRKKWQSMIAEKNPSLGGSHISLPVVTNALTHALSVCGQLFLDAGERLLTPDLYWGNYRLIFQQAWGARIDTWNTFTPEGGFDVAAMRAKLLEGTPGKRVVLLNFPNNPTGYTVTEAEAAAIEAALVEAAELGSDVVALIDDAYFGLVYRDGVMRQSIFARLAKAHERILAVKIDGATKEDYVWGFRVGFVTFGTKGGTPDLYEALEHKAAGMVRGSISNASHPAQSLLLGTYEHPDYAAQKARKFETLKARHDEVVRVLADHPEYADTFDPLPFNSGYFMCVRPKGVDSETVRQVLLKDFDTGLIAAGPLVRVAFSSAPKAQLAEIFENIHQAVLKARSR